MEAWKAEKSRERKTTTSLPVFAGSNSQSGKRKEEKSFWSKGALVVSIQLEWLHPPPSFLLLLLPPPLGPTSSPKFGLKAFCYLSVLPTLLSRFFFFLSKRGKKEDPVKEPGTLAAGPGLKSI